MKCSKCNVEMPYNAPNGKKLTEGNFLSYNISDAVYRNYYESDPFGAFCPECYMELFSGLKKYVNRTTTKTEEISNTFTSSTADYLNSVQL